MLNIRCLIFKSSNILSRNYARCTKGRRTATISPQDRQFNEFGDLTEQNKFDLMQAAENVENLHEEMKGKGTAKTSSYQLIAMEKSSRKWLKNKIIQDKYFKKDQEINLLTYDAKQQIRYLHDERPDEWTAEKLSKSFPISVEGVQKLLRSKLRLGSISEIQRHDKGVIQHWENLDKEMASKITSRYLPSSNGKALNRETFKQLAGPNSNLPVPTVPCNAPKTREASKAKGNFGMMVENHLKLKNVEK